MIELEDTLVEPFALDGMTLPLIRLSQEPEPPTIEVLVGDKHYVYDRSYPIKGHSAVMPDYVRELLSGGKQPLLLERPGRYYLYLAE